MTKMNKEEEEFYKKLLASFKIEAKEHIKEITDGLLKMEGELSDEDFAQELQKMFRAAHSLKGASRAVNHVCVETICQTIEDIFASLKEQQTKPSPSLIGTLYESMDVITGLIQDEEVPSVILEASTHAGLLQKLEHLMQHITSDSPPPTPVQNLPKETAHQPISSPPINKETTHQPISSPSTNKQTPQTIRASTTKIDSLLLHVEEMLMIKLSSLQKINSLKQLQSLLSQGVKHLNALDSEKFLFNLSREMDLLDNPHNLRQLSNQLSLYFDNQKQFLKELNDTLNTFKRHCEQDHRVICGMIDNVLDDTKEILMLPFSTVLESFPRMVRDLSKSLGKEVALHIEGGEIEIDRRILEQLKDPLIHILRNSIDHGIENPEERKKNHKNMKGMIKIEASQVSGNAVKILIADDGQGINIDKIKEIALRDGLISETEVKQFSEKEAIALIFHSGFSTSPQVTELSGRGIGMSVLAENVEKLGGRVSIESQRKIGTQIHLHLPLTLATFRGIHIQVSNQDYVLPTHHVNRVLRITKEQIKTVENRQILPFEGKSYAYLPLNQLLNLPVQEKEDLILIVLMIKAAETTVAIGIDKVISEQEVFVKGLGNQLKTVPYISSATVMEGGKIIPVLDPFDLIKTLTKNTLHPSQTRPIEQATETPIRTILIAEDSATSRILLKNILESAGYKVKSAVNGIEAFSVLGSEKIDLLLSDVEMPKMNGFELTAKVRSTEHLKELPVVLCTSRGSKEDREHGIEVGANAYLDKSGFMQSRLLEVVGQLL